MTTETDRADSVGVVGSPHPAVAAPDGDAAPGSGDRSLPVPWRPPPRDLELAYLIEDGTITADLWLSDSLGGADPGTPIWLGRLRGLALAGAAFTLPMSAWKAIGPLTTADLLLVATVLLYLPRFDLATARRLWFPALAVASVVVGATVGTVVAGSGIGSSADAMVRFLGASAGAMVLVACWRPALEQVRSFAWIWVAGGVASALVALFVPRLHDFLRPSGLTPHPTHLAIISVVLFGVALALIISERERGFSFRDRSTIVTLGAAAIILAGIVASGSRAGLMAALIVGFLTLVATRDRTVIRVAVILAAVGVIVAMLGLAGSDNAFERIASGDSSSDELRGEFNRDAWERFVDNPITGVGLGDVTEAHIFMLQLASAAGVLGIIGALMLLVLPLRTYVVAVWRRMAADPPRWALVAGFAAAVIGYLAVSFFQNVLWDRNVWMAIVLMTWVAAIPAPARD